MKKILNLQESTGMSAMSNARVINKVKNIHSVDELVNVLSNAKAKGHMAILDCETPIVLRKFPTDDGERVRIREDFRPTRKFKVSFNFADDTYNEKMCEALGVQDYQAHDSNRKHLVDNVLMQYFSTGTTCFIYMPTDYIDSKILLNGVEMSDTDKEYMKRYKPIKRTENAVEYRTVSVKNVRSITIDGFRYELNIQETIAA